MKVYIKLEGSLTKFNNNVKDKETGISLPDGATVSDLIKKIAIPGQYISLITINKKISTQATKINPGDEITFYPPIGGG